jgi:hypothetical protein
MLNMKIERITPSIAAEYLKYNTDNRKLRPWWVNSLAGCIERNEWILTHQGVAFDTTGKLIDGQHKLHAILTAGIPTEVAVYRGISPEAFKVLDVGIKRTYSDITGLSVKTAEVCRWLAQLMYLGNSTPSAEQVLSIANCGVAELHDELWEHCATNVAVIGSAPVRTAIVILMMSGHSHRYMKELFANLAYQNYSDLPPIGQAFIRQVNKRIVTPNNKFDMVTRGLKVFNAKNANVTKLLISDAEIETATAFIRKILNKALGVSHE